MSVIINNDNSSNRSYESENDDRREERMIGSGATLRHTLTHSLILSQISSLTIIHHIYNLGIQNYSLDCDDH